METGNKKKVEVVQLESPLPTKESIETDRRLKELNALRVDTKTVLPEVRACLSIEGIPVFEMSDINALKAKQKNGKTSALKVMAAAWLKGEMYGLRSELAEAKLLWIDTEQKLADAKRILDDIQQMTALDSRHIDNHLKLYSFRKLSYKSMEEDLLRLVKAYRPNVVIIDNLVDLVESFNDEVQSHNLVNSLVQMSEVYQCCIIAVLHENKRADDTLMRGHLGTLLSQKAGTVLQCKKDKKGNIVVSCSDSRHQEIPEWRIRYDEQGHIVSADAPTPSLADQRRQTILDVIQEAGGSIARKDLNEKLEAKLNLARTTVANMITQELKNGTIMDILGMIQNNPEIPW